MDFIIIQVNAFPLDVRRSRGEALHLRKLAGVAINQVSVFGNVGDNLRSSSEQLRAPLRLDRAGKLHQMQAPALKEAARFLQGLDPGFTGIKVAGMQGDLIIMIADFRARVREHLGGDLSRFVQAEPAIIGDQTATASFDLFEKGGITDLKFVGFKR